MRFVISNVERLVLIAIISLIFIVAEGSSSTFAEPEHDSKISFMGVTMTASEAPTVPLSFIKQVRGVSATYEHHIVSTALQLMRVTEGVKVVPTVTVSTNDMGSFPSPKHSLYPDYLVKRFSQFKYIVNSDGIVSVDTSVAITEVQFEKIDKWLKQLEEDI